MLDNGEILTYKKIQLDFSSQLYRNKMHTSLAIGAMAISKRYFRFNKRWQAASSREFKLSRRIKSRPGPSSFLKARIVDLKMLLHIDNLIIEEPEGITINVQKSAFQDQNVKSFFGNFI